MDGKPGPGIDTILGNTYYFTCILLDRLSAVTINYALF
jgi:hypothetical protein